jgi:membrane fusion protein, multidrug efflux system
MAGGEIKVVCASGAATGGFGDMFRLIPSRMIALGVVCTGLITSSVWVDPDCLSFESSHIQSSGSQGLNSTIHWGRSAFSRFSSLSQGPSLESEQESPQDFPDNQLESIQDRLLAIHRIEAAIVGPVQSANVAAEVGGIVDTFNYELGDSITKGQTIAEISKKRYALAARKAEERVNALTLALKRAQRDRDIKSTLVSMDASSEQELLKADAEVEITQHRIREAETDLEQARLELDACQVKAPFSGNLAIRYKEPHEATAPLEKLFFIVDTSRVYAIANVPESLSPRLKKGDKAKFNHSTGRQFEGTVDKVEPLRDPKTDTKKVYVLIDNSQGDLEAGMTGTVEPGQ